MADELPDDFVAGVHAAARAEKPDAVVIGEVWEDGSTKVAYGVRRKHILGRHCDGLMNYPFRGAALDYLRGGDAADFMETMETLRENYPPFAYYSAMNSLGTHDTPRILTLLGHLRQESPALSRGDIRYRAAQGPLLAFTRSAEGETILAAFNTGGESTELRLEDAERVELLLGSARFQISAQGHVLTLPPRTGSLLKISEGGVFREDDTASKSENP